MKNVSQLFFGSNENLITKYKTVQFYRFLRMLSDVNEEVSKRISFPLLEKFPFEININCHAFSSKREEESSSKIGGPSQISVH